MAGAAVAQQGTAVGTLKAELPKDMASAGKAELAMFVNPPFVIQEESKPMAGAAIDLAEAIGRILGLNFQYTAVGTTAANRLGVQSGRYAFTMGPYIDSGDTEKEMDVVAWVKTSPGFVHRGGEKYGEVMDLCGKTVGIVSGSTAAERNVVALSKACVAAGKKEAAMSGFGDQNAMLLAVEASRIDAALTSSASALYYEHIRSPRLKALIAESDVFGVGQYSGIYSRKGDPLSAVLAKAMQTLQADGSYAEIMAKYNLKSLAKDKIELNPLSR
jgi:ABC-type amino acid transport substrate-binding protein